MSREDASTELVEMIDKPFAGRAGATYLLKDSGGDIILCKGEYDGSTFTHFANSEKETPTHIHFYFYIGPTSVYLKIPKAGLRACISSPKSLLLQEKYFSSQNPIQ